MRKILISILILPLLMLYGCVYVADVQQGNIIEQKQLDQLKTGMSKKQVSFLLGSPIITDAFHKNEWDYVYTLRQGDSSYIEKRRLTLVFKGDKLISMVNDHYPNPKDEIRK